MSERLAVRKTYKLFIGGAFPRSESGRTTPVHAPDGSVLAQAPWASRKDVRDAVSAAAKAASGWASRTAYNRGQILYRVAEMLEGRADQFVAELTATGATEAAATAEVRAAVDRWVWYAGWTDKIATVAGGAVPVAGPYFTFTVPEPVGVVATVAGDDHPLLGLVSQIAPALAGGNVTVSLASTTNPLVALSFAEVLATSDVPGGVVNVLSGPRGELVPWLAGHGDVRAIDLSGCTDDERTAAREAAAEHVVRTVEHPLEDVATPRGQGPQFLTGLLETKTVWHPKGR